MPVPIVFIGRPIKVEPLRAHEGRVIVADLDPRYVVTVRVMSILAGAAPWTSDDPSFAIHSPSRTFRTADTPQGEHEFRLERDGSRWALTATPLRK